MNPQKEKEERHVVLVQPEVHWNTGNIGRTCLGTGTILHLIRPLGFSLESREVKRAGLDYWPNVRLHVWDDFQSFLNSMKPQAAEIAFFAKQGKRSFRDLPECPRLFLVFGRESDGLPAQLLETYHDHTFHIPITGEIRSLNLSTAVGIVLYESLRESGIRHFWG